MEHFFTAWVDIATPTSYCSLSSSVYGLLIEDRIRLEGPCQSLLANRYLKENPISERFSS
jgi:hypothetical protein